MKDGAEKGTPEPDPIVEINVDGIFPTVISATRVINLNFTAVLRNLITAKKDDLLDEITDRFGEPPEEIVNLWRVAAVRGLCRKMRISGISTRGNEVRITFNENAVLDTDVLLKMINAGRNGIQLKTGRQPQLLLKMNVLKTEPLPWLEKNLPLLAGKN